MLSERRKCCACKRDRQRSPRLHLRQTGVCPGLHLIQGPRTCVGERVRLVELDQGQRRGGLSWMKYRWGDGVRWVSWKNLGWINVES